MTAKALRLHAAVSQCEIVLGDRCNDDADYHDLRALTCQVFLEEVPLSPEATARAIDLARQSRERAAELRRAA